MSNKRTISLEPHSVGDLLQEVTRAHLHGSLPSSLVKRLKEGVDKFCTECTDEGSKTLAAQLSGELQVMYDTCKTRENNYYSM